MPASVSLSTSQQSLSEPSAAPVQPLVAKRSQVVATMPHCPVLNFPPPCVPQDALCGKGFGTDLPLVNSQVEEHNIFHNEVMAIGPHVTKEGTKVSSATPCRGGGGQAAGWVPSPAPDLGAEHPAPALA